MTRATKIKFNLELSEFIEIELDINGQEKTVTPAVMPDVFSGASAFDAITGDSVAGTFSQSPAAGTSISNKEPFDITVSFVPDDPSVYSSSTKTKQGAFRQKISYAYDHGFLKVEVGPGESEILHTCGGGETVRQYANIDVDATYEPMSDPSGGLGGTITYSPAIGTPVKETTVVTVTFTPTDQTANRKIEFPVLFYVVEKNVFCKKPEVRWPNGDGVGLAFSHVVACGAEPADTKYIIGSMGEYGGVKFVDPVTKEEVAGVIEITPPPGTQTKASFVATATFSPTDPEEYETATGQMSFRVANNTSGVKCGYDIFGCEIISVKSSIGWGQGGSCQISAVFEDSNAEGAKKPTIPALGSPCVLDLGGFHFGGILQRWSYKQSTDGLLYDFVIASPLKILDAVDVILSSFDGSYFNQDANKIEPYKNQQITKDTVKNVWNAYAEKENFSAGGIFGGANINSAGFPARELLKILEYFSKGIGTFGGKIKYGDPIEEFEFQLDLGQIMDVPEFFRISGQSMKLSNIISECADIIQHDYFANLKERNPPELAFGETLPACRVISNPVIEIIAMDKGEYSSLGVVEGLVEQAKDGGTLISADNGQELSDEVTNRMVIGGPASRYWVPHISNAYPIWGKLGPKRYVLSRGLRNVPSEYNNPDTELTIYLNELSEIGINGGISRVFGPLEPTYTATVAELRMATAGFESWAMFKTFESYYKGTYDVDPWCSMVDIDFQTLEEVRTGRAGPMTFASTSTKSAKKMYDPELKEGVQRLFEKVQQVANEAYGKLFLVPLPREPGGVSNNLRYIAEDQREEFSWQYTDAAWTSDKPVPDITFYDSSGRLKTTALFNVSSFYDYSDMGTQYASWYAKETGTKVATTKCTSADKDIWIDLFGRGYIAMELSAQVKYFDEWTTQEFGLTYLAKKFFNVYLPPEAYLGPGKQNTQVVVPPDVVYPEWIGVPQTSSRYSWGPWWTSSQESGKSEVLFDTNLIPENFGTAEAMNSAAQDFAGAGVAKMKSHESGRIELAELPRCSIAERIDGAGPYVTNMSIEASTNGFKTSYEFNTWTPNFGKLAKYNADRIQRIYKARIDALNRFSQDNPKQPLQPFPFKKRNFDDMSNRSNLNRTSAGFSLFRLFNNFKTEGDQVNIADAAGLSVNNLGASFGVSEDGKWSPVGTKAVKEVLGSGVYISNPLNIEEEESGPYLSHAFPNSRVLDPFFSEMGGISPSVSIQLPGILAANNSSQGETIDFQLAKANKESIVDEVRAIGLRGPMLLSGFGIDVAGNPVPFDKDSITQPAENVKDRGGWRTGPVNLMWDKERCVWSGGLEMLCGVLSSDITAPSSPLSPTTFTVNVFRKTDDAKGDDALSTTGESLTCYNRDPSLSQSASDSVFVIVLRINYEWTPIWVGCP